MPPQDVWDDVVKYAGSEMKELRRIKGKQERSEKIGELRKRMMEECFSLPTDSSYGEYKAAEQRQSHARDAFRNLEKKTTRSLIVEEGIRADGRALDETRAIESEVSLFARAHGSAMFQRGETQSLVSCVLGTGRDEQIVDGLMPEYAKKFYLHYNFPPFCVGEAGRIMGPGRREIGHGALAERSLMGILPDLETFPYTLRLVSDITESNGSSSMASVCGGCLALMDAGVPIKATCAGISVGRFSDDSGKIVRVTDIIGEEDFFGDMDFKVSGTREGITGIQLDLKARGLWFEEIGAIFKEARTARIQIIERDGSLPAQAASGNLVVRTASDPGHDRPGQDRQAHRAWWQDHPEHPGTNWCHGRRRQRRHRHHLLPGWRSRTGRTRPRSRHSVPRSRSGPSTKARSFPRRTSAHSSSSSPGPMACATSRNWTTASSSQLLMSSRSVT